MRRTDREILDKSEIEHILQSSMILHMGIHDDDFPYVVPLHYGYEDSDGKLIFYVHSAKEGHKLDCIRKNPNVCIEIDTDVSLVPGGDIPCHYGSLYSSFIGRGKAFILEDKDDKIKGLKILMKHQTGKEFQFDEKMTESVSVIRIEISSYTAKARKR